MPVQDVDGKLWSLQRIGPDGTKQFKEGGRVDGGHFVIGEVDQRGPLLIAEGYATAATVHELSGQPTVVAFNAGNLSKVAEAYRERLPDRQILIVADNDHIKEAAGKPNVGREKAQAAAKQIGGHVLLPPFAEGAKGTDWNDLAHSEGREIAALELRTAFIGAEREHIAARMAAARSVDRNASPAPVRMPVREMERESAGHER